MKLTFARGRTKGSRVLRVSLRGNESVNSVRLRWLMERHRQNLLPCVYEASRRWLSYDVQGLTSLRRYVRHTELSYDALARILMGVTEAVSSCVAGGSRCYHLLNDPSYVFMGTTCEPHLVLLPVDGVASLADKSPFESLALLCDAARVRYASPDAAELARRLGDFVLAQDEMLSTNALRHFVRSECCE